jgi:hypothetical protein
MTNEGAQQFYPATMPITLNAVNKENVSTGYQQAGQFTLNPTSEPGFLFFTNPSIQDVASGSPATYKLNVVSWGGFNDVIRFSANVPMENPTYAFNPPAVTGSGITTLTVSTAPLVGKPTDGTYLISVSGKTSSTTFERAVLMVVESGPPTISVTDLATPDGSQHFYGFRIDSKTPWWGAGIYSLNGFDALIGPALDGRNACWFYFDGKHFWLADDDGLTWSPAGPDLYPYPENSQCIVSLSSRVNPDWNVSTYIVFKSGFSAQNNKVFVRASNFAGFDTGYTLAEITK